MKQKKRAGDPLRPNKQVARPALAAVLPLPDPENHLVNRLRGLLSRTLVRFQPEALLYVAANFFSPGGPNGESGYILGALRICRKSSRPTMPAQQRTDH